MAMTAAWWNVRFLVESGPKSPEIRSGIAGTVAAMTEGELVVESETTPDDTPG